MNAWNAISECQPPHDVDVLVAVQIEGEWNFGIAQIDDDGNWFGCGNETAPSHWMSFESLPAPEGCYA